MAVSPIQSYGRNSFSFQSTFSKLSGGGGGDICRCLCRGGGSFSLHAHCLIISNAADKKV